MVLLLFAGVVAGLVCVWLAGDQVVAHALRLAKHYNVSTFFVGFVFLALAANLPELAVAIVADMQNVGQLAAGDIVGACFTDVALVTGLMLALAGSIAMTHQEAMGFLRLICGAAVVMAIVFCVGVLTFWHGIVLIGLYVAFLAWAWKTRHDHTLLEISHDDLEHPRLLPGRGLLMVWSKAVVALICVMGGSGLAIHCGVALATMYGLGLEAVGATIIAVGTSLPEVSMGFHAYRRGQYSLALGPTIGTVFSQSTFILGTLAVLSRQPIDLGALQGAAAFMFVAFAIIAASILLKRMGRSTGIALLSLFVMYILYHVV